MKSTLTVAVFECYISMICALIFISDICHIYQYTYINIIIYEYDYGIIIIMLELPAEFILGGPLLAAAADAHATSLKHADSASAAWSAR